MADANLLTYSQTHGRHAERTSDNATSPDWWRGPPAIALTPETVVDNQPTPTGLFDETTGMPIFATVDDEGNLVDHFYFDPTTGEKTMTTSGFTAQQSTTTVLDSAVYETLANGVVEKLDKFIPVVDGIPDPQSTTFAQIGTGVAYVPVDLTRVEQRPIKVQMDEATFTVTDAVFDFSTIVAGVELPNSEGEMFPQHGVFHVNADADATGYGIAYTTDGSDPANSATSVEFEVSAGQPFELDTYEELVNLRLVVINKSGDPDLLMNDVDVSYDLNNIGANKDDV